MTATAVPPASVLVVDDDATIAEVVVRYLEREGYRAAAASDGREALERIRADPPDLVVLDVMLPRVDGLEVCRQIRATSDVAVIMLTARGEETDRITGLERGADDYVTKPFSPRELTARVRSVLRRSRAGPGPGPATVLGAGGLEVDLGGRRVLRHGRELSLTAREFELLAFLMRHAGQVFSRQELLERVWGYTYGDTSTVTVHIRRLREKVEDDPTHPAHLQTVWGVGYRFDR